MLFFFVSLCKCLYIKKNFDFYYSNEVYVHSSNLSTKAVLQTF